MRNLEPRDKNQEAGGKGKSKKVKVKIGGIYNTQPRYASRGDQFSIPALACDECVVL